MGRSLPPASPKPPPSQVPPTLVSHFKEAKARAFWRVGGSLPGARFTSTGASVQGPLNLLMCPSDRAVASQWIQLPDPSASFSGKSQWGWEAGPRRQPLLHRSPYQGRATGLCVIPCRRWTVATEMHCRGVVCALGATTAFTSTGRLLTWDTGGR